jgi:hypothetical protein
LALNAIDGTISQLEEVCPMKKLIGGMVSLGISMVAMPTLAIPEPQIIEKLQNIPVFGVSDSKGAPLIVTPKDPKSNARPYTGVFLSQREARSFVQSLAKDKPELVKSLLIRPLSLSEVYKIQQSNQNNKQAVDILFVPTQQQVQVALPILQKTEPKVTKFDGVPLFTAIAGNNKPKGYLTLSQNKQQIVPVFFDREQLQELIDKFKVQQPALASTVEVQVLNLEGLLATLKSKNDSTLSQVVIYPSRESIEYLKSITPQPTTKPGVIKPSPKPAIPVKK